MSDTEKQMLVFDGQEVEFASISTYTMDEAMVMWGYTKMTLDEVEEIRGFVPGVVAAFMHISFARANPRVHERNIRKKIGAIPLSDLETIWELMSEEVDEEQVPPPIALEPPSADGGTTSNDTGELSLVNNPEPGSGPPGSLTSLEDFRRVVLANSPPGSSTAFGS